MRPPIPSDPSTDEPLAPAGDQPRRVVSVKGTKGDPAREARIKAALKANIARRKAQARARQGTYPQDEGQTDD